MVEVIDNALQLLVTAGCTVYAAIIAVRKRSQEYLLLTCFYGSFALGLLYWLIYLILNTYTPQVFYVSDLTWIASWLFLLTLVLFVATPEEKKFRHITSWISPILGFGFMLFYFCWGDYITNFIFYILTASLGWLATGGLIYCRRQTGKARERQYFYTAVLFFVITQYAIWTSSCFWVSDTLTNPYFWFDFMVTISFVTLIPPMKKVVAE